MTRKQRGQGLTVSFAPPGACRRACRRCWTSTAGRAHLRRRLSATSLLSRCAPSNVGGSFPTPPSSRLLPPPSSSLYTLWCRVFAAQFVQPTCGRPHDIGTKEMVGRADRGDRFFGAARRPWSCRSRSFAPCSRARLAAGESSATLLTPPHHPY